MIWLVKLIDARNGMSAISRDTPDGEPPYTTIPGLTQSRWARGCHSAAAELARLRSPGISLVAASNRSTCQSISLLSALAKWLISVMLPIDSDARARSQAAR